VLGTDFPYENGDLFRRAISYISGGLGADAAGVLDGNAAALLGL
jgi:6-methylsalicylate decarboxylase